MGYMHINPSETIYVTSRIALRISREISEMEKLYEEHIV